MTEGQQQTATAAKTERLPEPWLRGTHGELAPAPRAVLHSLEMAREDIQKWCGALDAAELFREPHGLPSPASQLRHIAGTLDRFITYAEGGALSVAQMAALAEERQASAGSGDEALGKFGEALDVAQRWLKTPREWRLDAPLKIGRKEMPTTVGGLLVHMAEHTQRHVGQTITTVKVLLAARR